jgi:ribonucleotide reductase beta subunit family protein with ferritin-like domain
MTSEFVSSNMQNVNTMYNKEDTITEISVNNTFVKIEYTNNKTNLEFKNEDQIKQIKNEISIKQSTEISKKKENNKSVFDNDKMYYQETLYEPITDKNYSSRFNLSKMEYPELWENYLTQRRAYWTPDELDFTKDYENFTKLDDNKQHVVKMILAFFANLDAIVNINISEKIINNIYPIEITTGYKFQVAIENIHNETYTRLLDILIKDPVEKDFLFNSIENINSVKLISNWAFKWIDSDVPLACRIVAFACIEGILFSSAFAFIFWLKESSMGDLGMEGLFRSNEFISRDEGLHKDYAILLFKRLKNKPSNSLIIEIIKEAVSIGEIFNKETITSDILGLSSNDMNIYIKYVADRLCYSIIGKKIYNANNPFPFMETIGMQSKTNFHESRNTEYKTAHSTSGSNKLEIMDDY